MELVTLAFFAVIIWLLGSWIAAVALCAISSRSEAQDERLHAWRRGARPAGAERRTSLSRT